MEESFVKRMSERVLILDGAMGTQIMKLSRDFDPSIGSIERLNLTHPHIVENVHLRYLNAGADIITTNTICANRIDQLQYKKVDTVYEMNVQGVKAAKQARSKYFALGNSREVLIAGSVGPTRKRMMGNTNETISKEDYTASVTEQANALLEGGVDLLILETFYDYKSLEITLDVVNDVMISVKIHKPIIVSFTIGQDGCIWKDESVRLSIEDCIKGDVLKGVVALGINCSFGVGQSIPYVIRLVDAMTLPVVFYPNKGLSNEHSIDDNRNGYSEELVAVTKNSRIRIIGGCCGSTPDDINSLTQALQGVD